MYYGKNSIKINRAMDQSRAGKYPYTFSVIVQKVASNTNLLSELTSKQLAQVFDAMLRF